MQPSESTAAALDTGTSTLDDESETRKAEVQRLKAALKKAEDTIKAMQDSRRTIAMRLKDLGETVLVNPRTVEWLEEEIDRREDDLCANDTEIGRDEDATEQERCASTYIQHLRDALEGGFPCDAEGYINEEGKSIEFEPTDEELEDFHWENVGYSGFR